MHFDHATIHHRLPEIDTQLLICFYDSRNFFFLRSFAVLVQLPVIDAFLVHFVSTAAHQPTVVNITKIEETYVALKPYFSLMIALTSFKVIFCSQYSRVNKARFLSQSSGVAYRGRVGKAMLFILLSFLDISDVSGALRN